MIFGTKKYHCRECIRISKLKENLPENQINAKKIDYEKRMKDPIKKLRKQTLDRIYKRTKRGI